MPKTEHQPHTRESIFRDNCARFPHRPKILTEGDSWFDLPFPDRNIVDQLITHYSGEANWLRLEHVGDEATQMFFTEERLRQVEGMENTQSQRAEMVSKCKTWKFQLILISAGGNDLIGNEGWFFGSLIKSASGSDPRPYLNMSRLARKLDEVFEAFDQLIRIRDQHQMGVPIVVHGYDYAIPQPKGAELFTLRLKGPWMWEHVKHLGDNLRCGIARVLMDELNDRMQRFADTRANFHYVDARNSVRPETGPFGWLDEIHPAGVGFHAVAKHFVPLLRRFCPGSFQRDWPLGAD
jgi:hypothetical protein